MKQNQRFKTGHYAGNKWGGKFLRAPDIFFTILEKGKGKLVRLGDIAEVRFGIKTGANDFFYLPSKYFDIKEEGDYYKLIPKQEGLPNDIKIEKEFLKPVIKSPRECKTILINPKDLKYKVFICNKSKRELRGTGALKYIEWGEKKWFNKRPTCKNRKLWWELGNQEIPMYLWGRIHNGSHRIYESSVYAADTFSTIHPKKNFYLCGAILNSTLTWLMKEMYGRKSLGEGGLSSLGIDIIKINLINPEILNRSIINTYNILKTREIKPIFEELGFDPSKPIREQEPKPLPDRAELDKIIFDELGLTEEERKEVYWAVAELVKQRLDKARSLKKK